MGDDPNQTKPTYWIGQETTRGTPAHPFIPALWEGELRKAVTTQTPAWPRTPRKPLTWRTRLRLLWWRVKDVWPLHWKDRRSEDEWD